MSRTLLVVDDIDTNRLILKKILAGEYEILEAADGEGALEVMRREYRRLSAVLLDLLMPGMDGFEVLRQIRMDDRLSQIPIIVTTGASKEDSEVRALELGCHDYISKPYNSLVIKQRLKNTINLRETAAAVNALQRDALTGLYTREVFFEKARDMIAGRAPGFYMFSCFDIDNFKVINDQYGMENGDMVLKHVAHCLDRYSFEMGGLCSRITADNFALIYPNTPENLKTMEKCHQAAVDMDFLEQTINIRIGRYAIDDVSLTVNAMYDRAMMAAERVRGVYGKYIAQYDESMRSRILREQEIVFEMNNALRNGQFEVWLQPQFNHSTGDLIGAEALSRWRHPKKGMIPPAVFIPVFERSGFIYELDKFVWDKVCGCMRRWLDEGRKPVRVSVNVSRNDALRRDFFSVITSILEKYRLPADMMHLEITESAFADSSKQLITIVKRLIDYGFTIEIDDFGSGYSSLNTLKDVPASVLKLDMKFLDSEGDSSRGGNIVESVVRMAKWLGMAVIAEGVETKEDADFLKSIGCSYVQGYLYGSPMTVLAFERMADKARAQKDKSELKTVDSLDNNAFWNPMSVDTMLFNNFIGGACVLEYHAGKVELIRANDKFAKVLGGGKLSGETAMGLDWNKLIDDGSKIAFWEAMRLSLSTGEEVTKEYVFNDIPGCPKKTYIMATMRVIATAGDRYLVYCSNENVTSLRLAEQISRENADSVQRTLPLILNALMRSTSDLSFAKDVNFKYICCSRAFANMSGIEDEKDVAGKTDYDIYPADMAGKYRCDDIRLLQMGEPIIDMIEPIPDADGVKHYSCTSKYPLLDAEGNTIGLFGVGRDITKYRSAFEQLKLVTDTIPGGVATYVATKEGLRLTYLSENYFAHTGYTKDEYMALAKGNPLCLVFKQDMHIINDAVAKAFAGENEFCYEYRASRKDGGYCWLRIQGVVVERSMDSFTTNVVKYDITQLKTAQERLRIRNEEMRLALGEMGRLIFLYDIPSRRVAVPKAYAMTHGLDEASEYMPICDLLAVAATQDDLMTFSGFFEEIAAGKERCRAKVYMALPSGQSRLESAESVTIFDDAGRPARAIISVEDITDRHRDYDRMSAERERQARLAAEYKRLFTDASTEMYSHIIKVDMPSGDTYKIEFKNGVMTQKDLKQKWNEYYEDFLDRVFPDDSKTVYEKTFAGDLNNAALKDGVKIIYRCRLGESGGYRWYSTVMRRSVDETDAVYALGEPGRYVTAFTVDINDDMRERARLTDLSEHDGLTDLYNLVKYSEMLTRYYRNMDSCGVLFFDVNYLKETNDAYGHETGNVLLRTVADSIRSITNRRIQAYRYGGDEFLVVVCDACEKEMDELIDMWAERLSALSENRGQKCSVAVGKAFARAPYAMSALIDEADRDMYKDKERKKRKAFPSPP